MFFLTTYTGHWRGHHCLCIHPSIIRCEILNTQMCFTWSFLDYVFAEMARGIYWKNRGILEGRWCVRRRNISNIINLITKGHACKMNLNWSTARMWHVCQQLTHIGAKGQYWKGQTISTYAKVLINELLSESHLLRNSILMWRIVCILL